MQDLSLAKIEEAFRALEATTTVQEVKNHIDTAKAAGVYAKQARLGKDLELKVADYIREAETKLGDMLLSAKAAGQITHAHDPRHKSKPVVAGDDNRSFTLEEAGISRDLSSRAQKIASIPKEERQKIVSELKKSGKNPTSKMVIQAAKSNGKKPASVPKPHYREEEILALADCGMTCDEIAAKIGIGYYTVRDNLERGRIRRGSEPQITPDGLSMTGQQKLDLAIKQAKHKLDAEFHQAVNSRVQEFLEQTIGPMLQKQQDEAKWIIKSRKGVMNRNAYRKILSCLHPDRVTHPEQKEMYAEAFRIFTVLEKVLLDEKNSPTQFVNIPKTRAEWDELKRQAASARKNKKHSGNTAVSTQKP